MNGVTKKFPKAVIEQPSIQKFLEILQSEGYETIGPTVRDGAVVYDRISNLQDLPVGIADEQEGGRYRIKPNSKETLFDFTVGPTAWKTFLFPSRQRLFTVTKRNGSMKFEVEAVPPVKRAFFGVRSCELHAIAVQDRVFLGGRFQDPVYSNNRKDVLIIGVNCGRANATCFCASMGTGPRVERDFDLVITEIPGGGAVPEYVIESGSDQGATLLRRLPGRDANGADLAKIDELVRKTAESQKRSLDTRGIKELLYANLEHPRWDEVAERCLSCANCTLVCPTCFCTTVEDVTDLTGEHAERWRQWDSCFTTDFTFTAGGAMRASVKSRYRQWLTHKIASWIDQFGTSGCVGCGRCITWCPVGIDLTEEVAAIRNSPIPGNHKSHLQEGP